MLGFLYGAVWAYKRATQNKAHPFWIAMAVIGCALFFGLAGCCISLVLALLLFYAIFGLGYA